MIFNGDLELTRWVSWLTLILGCLIGSFLNVVIYRLPAGKSVIWPPSACPQCQEQIKPYDNIPVLSWLWLQGKCRNCSTPISPRYPINEAITGGLFFAAFWQWGMTWQFFASALFLISLQIIFWIDIDHLLILNVITYPLVLLGLAYQWTQGNLIPAFLAALGAVIFFEAVAWGSLLLLGKEGMGGGDTKLAAAMGAWLGPQSLVVGLFTAFLVGSIIGAVFLAIKGRSEYFPFGPALVIGAALSLFWGGDLWQWYQQMLVQ